ncbi:MAG: hypothetical protein Q9160_005198 [Pyrenula sp. 1 TL-2023]
MSKSLKDAAKSNPTLLGDPTSIKSETREIPNPDDDSNSIAPPSSSSPSPSSAPKTQEKGKAAKDISNPQSTYASSHAPVMAPAPTEADIPASESQEKDTGVREGEGKSLKQRAEEKLKQNPTALGDPTSLKAETSENVPTREEEGGGGQGAKKEGEEDASRKQERWKRVSKI